MGILNFIFGNKRRNEEALSNIEPLFTTALKGMMASLTIYASINSDRNTIDFAKLVEGKKTFNVGITAVEIEFANLRVMVWLRDKGGSTIVIGANASQTGEFDEPLGYMLAGLYQILTEEKTTLESVCNNPQCAYIIETGIFGVGTAVATLQSEKGKLSSAAFKKLMTETVDNVNGLFSNVNAIADGWRAKVC